MIRRKRSCTNEILTPTTVNDVNKKLKSKTPVRSLTFEKFLDESPHELIMQLKGLLRRCDFISVASTNKRVRTRLLAYIFDQVKCSWHELLESWQHGNIVCAPISHPELIEGIRITSFCSKNEWTFPFHVLFDTDVSKNSMVNLRRLSMLSSGSTNFFKYCEYAPNLKQLCLKAVKSSSVFSLEHIRNFNALEELVLSDFHLEDFEETANPQIKIKSLKLNNCSWCYPFNLESFGKDTLRSLSLTYSNSFIVSERFKFFLSSPSFTNLNKLSIRNNEKSLELTISLKIMNLIRAMPTLEVLLLAGNIYNEALNMTVKSSSSSQSNVVAVNHVKVLYSS